MVEEEINVFPSSIPSENRCMLVLTLICHVNVMSMSECGGRETDITIKRVVRKENQCLGGAENFSLVASRKNFFIFNTN